MKKLFTLLILCVALLGGHPAMADFDAGLDAFIKGDHATALREFRPLAEQGNGGAQGLLGYMYYNGEGVVQNYQEAAKWTKLAAEQGFVEAQVNLSEMYRKGDGVAQDTREAFKWIKLAAEQGNDFAQFNLGKMYYEGIGVPKDSARAHMWISLSALNGNRIGAEAKDPLFQNLTFTEKTEAVRLMKECKAKDYKGC